MPLVETEDAQIDYNISCLARLRFCRERFNSEVNLRELGLLSRLSELRGLELNELVYQPLRRHPLSATSSKRELSVKSTE